MIVICLFTLKKCLLGVFMDYYIFAFLFVDIFCFLKFLNYVFYLLSTIRQQLTNTEDIRRVRKKAPCTHLEVWVLQKQFLEDELFSEPVFTGI